jgi:hypothetical protein
MTETVKVTICHGMYSPIVTLTVSGMVYTYQLKRWQCRSGYVSPTLTLTVSVMVHIYLLLRLQCTSWYILT